MSHEASDVNKYGGYIKKDRDMDRRSVEYQPEQDDEMLSKYPEPEDYDPLEEADKWGHSGGEPVKWHKERKGIIKGKGWGSNHKKGLPTHVKSSPANKFKGQSPFRKLKKSWNPPW